MRDKEEEKRNKHRMKKVSSSLTITIIFFFLGEPLTSNNPIVCSCLFGYQEKVEHKNKTKNDLSDTG